MPGAVPGGAQQVGVVGLVLLEVVVPVVVGGLGHVVVLPGMAGGLHPPAMVPQLGPGVGGGVEGLVPGAGPGGAQQVGVVGLVLLEVVVPVVV